MELFEQITASVSSFLWDAADDYITTGNSHFLTIRLKLPQRNIYSYTTSFKKDPDSEGDVSQYPARFATSLAATIGTGNIIVWRLPLHSEVSVPPYSGAGWPSFRNCHKICRLLAIKYRVKNVQRENACGPMYALERGLKPKWLGILFCIFTAMAFWYRGSTVQANSIIALLMQRDIRSKRTYHRNSSGTRYRTGLSSSE